MDNTWKNFIADPITFSPQNHVSDDFIAFKNGDTYPVVNGIPVIINEANSLFTIKDILAYTPQTQDRGYSNEKSFKNYFRRRMLPKLTSDKGYAERFASLAALKPGGKILVLGAGERTAEYKNFFCNHEVCCSDVHLQYGPDIVFDAHNIPFQKEYFDGVVACQVLEHTIKPWEAAKEMQRVCRPGAFIHIEVPFAFPYHSPPYDFFRFTFTGLRSLFNSCKLIFYSAPEGNFSAAAVAGSQATVLMFRAGALRQAGLFISRILFFWMKYLDSFKSKTKFESFINPKGICMTFIKDNEQRGLQAMLGEYYELIKKR